MRTLSLFAIVTAMTTVAEPQTLPAPQAITDPKQITSRPNAQVEKNLSIEKLYMTRQVGGADWSPDGKTIVFVSNMSGRNNLWTMPSEGGWPMQLTVSDQRQTSPAWSPDGKWIAYMSDYDGDEQWDIFFVSPKTGQVVNVTNTREIAEESPAWSPDGRYLAYMVKPKTSSVFEIDVYDTLQREVKHLTTGTANDRMNVSPIWSKDGKCIVYTQEQSKGTDSNVFMVDVASAQSTLLTPHEGERLYSANDISPDGKHVLITSNAANGYQNAGLLDIATKKIQWLTEDKWEVSGGSFSPDGRHLTYTANVDGNTDIYLYDLATGKAKSLPLPKGLNEPTGGASTFSRDNARLLYYHNGPTAPGDLWTYTLADDKSRQITNSLIGGVRSQDMVEPYLVHYPSKDGKWTISAFVYAPYNLPRNGQHPAINRADPEHIQPVRAIHGQSGIPGDRAQLSRIYRLRQRVSASESIRHGRRRLAGRTLSRRLDQADRLCRSEETHPDGRQLRRLSDHDGGHQGAGRVGRRRADRSVRELVHRNPERRSGPPTKRPRDHGRSRKEQSTL